MPDALVGTDLHLAADVLGDLAAQVTLDLEVDVDVVAELDQVLVSQIARADIRRDARTGERLAGAGRTNAEDVGESDLDPLVPRKVNTGEACHACAPLVPSRASGLMRHRPDRLRSGPGLKSPGVLTVW